MTDEELISVYPVEDDVNETLEKIYKNEQRPFKISVHINKRTHNPHSPILIAKDTDFNSFRGRIVSKFQEMIEDYDGKCILPENLDHLIVGFKVYRLYDTFRYVY